MASQFQFIKPVGAEFAPTHTLSVYEGPDWCLEELQTFAGTIIHCWSYEIVELNQLGDGSLVREIAMKPHDWVGSCLLRTLQVPCRLQKVDGGGVWLQTTGWDRLQRPSQDRAAAEAWRVAPAGEVVAATAQRVVATVAAAAGKPERGVESSSRGRGGGGRGGRGMGMGRGGRGGGMARGGHRVAAAGETSVVCRIRLPATSA